VKLNVSLGTLAGVQLIAGLALQFIVLGLAGAGAQTDAFIAAQTIPLLAFSVLSMPLQGLWLPRLAMSSSDASRWRAEQSVALGQALLLVGGICVALGVSTKWWLPLIFPGLPAPQLSEAQTMTQILLVGTALNAQAALCTAALRGRDQFILRPHSSFRSSD
jgi:putative peptidoglycan lipid II flippase